VIFKYHCVILLNKANSQQTNNAEEKDCSVLLALWLRYAHASDERGAMTGKNLILQQVIKKLVTECDWVLDEK